MKRALVLTSLAMLLGACGEPAAPARAPVSPAPAPQAPPVASAAPAADPAPVTEGDTTVAWVRGMQILVRRRPGAELTAANLVVRGGVRNWKKEQAGIEEIAFRVAEHGGTKALPKEPFSRRLAALGAHIGSRSTIDYVTLEAKAPKGAWDETFGLLADVLLTPAMPPSEIRLTRERKLNELRHEMEDGDGRLDLLVRRSLFANHPSERSIATLESVGALTDADLTAHLEKLRETSRLLLVVVGDVEPSHVIDLATRAFASVPRGSYVESPLPPLHFDHANLATDTFKLPTNYVETAFAAPPWNDRDFVPMWLGMATLQERVWEEVRTKRNLSYAPSAWLQRDASTSRGALYVTAVDPTTTMKVMLDQARRLREEPIADKELAAVKGTLLTGWESRHREGTDDEAYTLGDIQVRAGDWHVADGLLGRFRSVTPAEIQAAAKKWMTAYQTSIVGDPSKLDPSAVLTQ